MRHSGRGHVGEDRVQILEEAAAARDRRQYEETISGRTSGAAGAGSREES